MSTSTKKNTFMQKILLTALILIMASTLQAQKNNIAVQAGLSFNGTGDTKGLMYSTEYSKYLKKSKNFYSLSFGGSIHGSFFPILAETPNGELVDASVNYTIAGFQTAFQIGRNFSRKPQNEFYLKVGPIVRYQSSSYWDEITVLYPALTGLNVPVVFFANSTPRNTIAVGAFPQIGYSYTNKEKFNFGVVGGMQFDTQGDVLSHIMLKVGKRF